MRLLPALLAGLSLVVGCQLVGNIEEAYEVAPDAGTRSDASNGALPDCRSPADCPRADGPCKHSVCTEGHCGFAPDPDGPLFAQTPGDCKRVECAKGERVEVAALDDPPADDGKECTDEVCVGSTPDHRPKNVGVGCGDGGVCNGSGECGACKVNDKVCLAGGVPAVCDANGAWVPSAACGVGKICEKGACVDQPSCVGLPSCVGGTRSCCDAPAARGGTVDMGRGTGPDADPGGASNEQPEHATTVASFQMDAFPVTVGRFRKFVDAYTGVPPATGAGQNPNVPGSGWQAAWNASLPADKATLRAQLACSANASTWSDTAGTQAAEERPINCTSWFVAFAFCVWDGSRLPTEAEWEYLAAGADENRKYAWGQVAPSSSTAPVDCLLDTQSGCALSDVPVVGSFPAGAGRFGHSDLAGAVRTWVLDWFKASYYTDVAAGCTNCANLTPSINRVHRGGAFSLPASAARAAARSFAAPDSRAPEVGIRCAR